MRWIKDPIDRIRHTLWYEAVFVGLAISSILMLAHEFAFEPSSEIVQIYAQIDLWIAWFFTADFFLGLWIARHKKLYWKQNWLLLLSSVPIHENIFRSLRIIRLFRIVRLLRSVSNATHPPRKVKRV